jgi:Asp-tRNA(Asn)/Glu-tRNA(Gln) amidotransferase A subunit family amidase
VTSLPRAKRTRRPEPEPVVSKDLTALSAEEAADAVRTGRLTALALVEACLERIAAREPTVHAWSFLDPDMARQRARLADAWRAAGHLLGPLHGLPVGVKDVFDTSDMPSEYGSALFKGRRPRVDASAVAVLRQAGAVIIGKTVTSEFGMYHPSETRNPHDPARSPGVSSAGSAACVADHMVPLALGTQHTASTTLPASFCGTFAYKPSHGFASMEGSNILVPRMAHLGFLARSVGDLALFASAFDRSLAAPALPERPPRLALARGPDCESAAHQARSALRSLVAALPVPVPEIALPAAFAGAVGCALGLLDAHLAHRFGTLPHEAIAGLCPPMRAGIAAGRAMTAAHYLDLVAAADRLAAEADSLFDGVDALVSLAALDEATLLADGPGSGALSMPWSLCGLPIICLPLLRGVHGLPIGVLLIGRRGGDRDLLGTAAWLANAVADGVGIHVTVTTTERQDVA